jgi:hypothetical protein
MPNKTMTVALSNRFSPSINMFKSVRAVAEITSPVNKAAIKGKPR